MRFNCFAGLLQPCRISEESLNYSVPPRREMDKDLMLGPVYDAQISDMKCDSSNTRTIVYHKRTITHVNYIFDRASKRFSFRQRYSKQNECSQIHCMCHHSIGCTVCETIKISVDAAIVSSIMRHRFYMAHPPSHTTPSFWDRYDHKKHHLKEYPIRTKTIALYTILKRRPLGSKPTPTVTAGVDV